MRRGVRELLLAAFRDRDMSGWEADGSASAFRLNLCPGADLTAEMPSEPLAQIRFGVRVDSWYRTEADGLILMRSAGDALIWFESGSCCLQIATPPPSSDAAEDMATDRRSGCRSNHGVEREGGHRTAYSEGKRVLASVSMGILPQGTCQRLVLLGKGLVVTPEGETGERPYARQTVTARVGFGPASLTITGVPVRVEGGVRICAASAYVFVPVDDAVFSELEAEGLPSTARYLVEHHGIDFRSEIPDMDDIVEGLTFPGA